MAVVGILKTMFVNDVAWETCQWMPVPDDDGGMRVVSRIKLRIAW